MLKVYLRPIYRMCKILWKINLLKTCYVNFRKLPFLQAIHFPIYVYGPLKIDTLRGKIIIDHPIVSGMIIIGYDIDATPYSGLKTRLTLHGSMTFKGYAVIGRGVTVISYGEIEIGNCCTIGGGSLIKGMEKITIGDNTRITFSCIVFDSNIHFIKNIETGKVGRNTLPIVIGKNCWINSGAFISKGSVIPDYSIVGRNSIVNKDYSQCGANLYLAGAPAKVLSSNVQRIFSIVEERKLNDYFRLHLNENFIELETGLMDEPGNEDYFRWLI